MNSTSIVASGHPTLAYNGEPTFAGILQKYYWEYDSRNNNVGISRQWNKKTAAACLHDYDRRILPCLEAICGQEFPASKLTRDVFEQVLDRLAEENHYSDSTINHYRHLIVLAYKAGVDHNHYPDDLLWEDLFDAETASEAEQENWRVKVMTRMRKSFSVDEELKLVQWFSELEPETASGEDIGLLLMFTLGLRNNEACGANYGSIHPLDCHPDAIVFDMLQSTKIDSSELKIGGKTSNAPRTLLLIDPVSDLIQRRRNYLEKRVADSTLSLPSHIKAIDDLPIVCKRDDYIQRASSNDLAAAGKTLFNKIGIDQSELAALFQILCSSEIQQLQIEDKEPTTYLFRRNCATHLYQLGFTPSEIQYWMGHEIEDPFTRRSFFADSDQIYALKEKWDRHPIIAALRAPLAHSMRREELPVRGNARNTRICVSVENKKTIMICAESQEPRCEIKVSIHCDNGRVDGKYQLVPRTMQYSRSADITEAVNETYRNHIKLLNITAAKGDYQNG